MGMCGCDGIDYQGPVRMDEWIDSWLWLTDFGWLWMALDGHGSGSQTLPVEARGSRV